VNRVSGRRPWHLTKTIWVCVHLFELQICRFTSCSIKGSFHFRFTALVLLGLATLNARADQAALTNIFSPTVIDRFVTIDDSIIHFQTKQYAVQTAIEVSEGELKVARNKWEEVRSKLANRQLGDSTQSLLSQKAALALEQINTTRLKKLSLSIRDTVYTISIDLRTISLCLSHATITKEQLYALQDLLISLSSKLQGIHARLNEKLNELDQLQHALTPYSSPDSVSADYSELFTLQQSLFARQDSLLHAARQPVVHAVEKAKQLQAEVKKLLSNRPLGERIKEILALIHTIWNYPLRKAETYTITVGQILLALFLFAAGLKIAGLFSHFVQRTLLRRIVDEEGVQQAMQRLLFYALATVFLLYALHIVKVPLTAFTVLGGALALGVGFGSQNILNNFISGIILLLERPIKVGDFVEVDNILGTVERIGMRSTLIKTPGNTHLIIPNSSFLEKNVANWTHSDRLIRLELSVGAAYGSDVQKVKSVLEKVCAKTADILANPSPLVLFDDFGSSTLDFKVSFWVRIQRIQQRRKILSDLRFAVDESFKHNQIVIAFPQRDVHLDLQAPLDVRLRSEQNST